MIDITHKITTLRQARAQALLICKKETLAAIQADSLPKGDLFNIAKAAAFLGAKQTAHLLPHCHPLLLEHVKIAFEYIQSGSIEPESLGLAAKTCGIQIVVEAECVAKTGIEMEALTAASIAALTMMDLLKPIDKTVEMAQVKLLEKKGGKTQFIQKQYQGLRAVILTCSDRASRAEMQDLSGPKIEEKLKTFSVEIVDKQIVPDDADAISDFVHQWAAAGIELIFSTGGTGFSERDNTVSALKPLLDYVIPGISETMRHYGQLRTPYAMMSRSFAGVINKSLVIAMPGSVSAVTDCLTAIVPYVFKGVEIIQGRSYQ